MRRINAILFDLGDTLLDFGPLSTREMFARGARMAYRYLQEMGHSLPPFRTYHRRQLRSVQWHYLRSRIIRREFNALDVLVSTGKSMGYHLSVRETEELAWQWYSPLGSCATIEDGLPEMLAQFRRDGMELGVVSNTFVPGQVLDRHLTALGLAEHLSTRVYSCDVRYRKPDPRIFQLAADRTGVPPGQTLFVGDNFRTDVLGARRAGMIPVLKDPSGAHRHRRIKPDHRIASLKELPRIVGSYNRG